MIGRHVRLSAALWVRLCSLMPWLPGVVTSDNFGAGIFVSRDDCDETDNVGSFRCVWFTTGSRRCYLRAPSACSMYAAAGIN